MNVIKRALWIGKGNTPEPGLFFFDRPVDACVRAVIIYIGSPP